MKKRILGILLCLCMALMIFPVTAFALEPDPTVQSPVIDGNNVTFNYYNPDATSVQLFGSMTNWMESPLDMTYNTETGYWSITLTNLACGTYPYKFFVNGNNVIDDPLNTNVNGCILEIPEVVTSIAVTVDTPIVGEVLENHLASTSNPTGALQTTSYQWYRIAKNAYTGGAGDVWEEILNGIAFDELHFYKAVLSFDTNDSFDGTYVIPDDIIATINGKNCDIQVATDGKSCQVSYRFEAKSPLVSNIAVAIDEPALGETPDYSPEFTPDDSIELHNITWYKLPKESAPMNGSWDVMGSDEIFTEGYYYGLHIDFTAKDGFHFDGTTSGTVNGTEYDRGRVWDDVLGFAIIEVDFDPLQYTVTVPFTTTVMQGGNVAPGETVFSLAVVETNAGEENYADVTVSATVTTNGAGSYSGTMTFTGPFEQVRNMLCEGAFVQQVNAGAPSWTYDDTVWGLILTDAAAFAFTGDAGSPYSVLIFPANCEATGDGGMEYSMVDGADAVERMNFTNTYTKSATGSTQPTENNPNTAAVTNPKTGDNSNLTLWFALLVVSTAGVIGTGVYSKRRRSF